MYMKYGGQFIEWEWGRQAHNFGTSVREMYGAFDPEPANAVFHGAPGFELKEGPFRRRLEVSMVNYFSDIAEEVLKLCLEGPR